VEVTTVTNRGQTASKVVAVVEFLADLALI